MVEHWSVKNFRNQYIAIIKNRLYAGYMPEVSCKICYKNFYAKPNWISLGWGKFCSIKCRSAGARLGKKVNCFICKKEVYKTQKALKNSRSGKFFCSKSCQTVWRNSMVNIGKKHPNWKSGKYSSYKKILDRNNIQKICVLCKTSDKRVLAVHHVDGSHKNNSLTNLTWLCHNCHILVHYYVNERNRFLKSFKNRKSPEGRSSSNG